MIYQKAWETFFINLYEWFIKTITSLNDALSGLISLSNIFILIIIGLSLILGVFNVLWKKHDDYMNGFHVTVMVLTTLIAIVEIVFLLSFFKEDRWFFDISTIGFGMFAVYFLIFSFILANQAYAYYQLSMQLPIEGGQDNIIKTTMGVYPLFVVVSYFLKYTPGLGIGLGVIVIMQLGLSFMIITACNRDGKTFMGFMYSFIFLIWSVALSAMLSYFLIYLIAALVIGLAIGYGLFLLYDMSQTKFSPMPKMTEKAATEYVRCELCGAMLPKESPHCNCRYGTWK